MLIVGGGIIGSSVAWSLASLGVRDVAVVDVDLAGVHAASELNAGGARATWWQPVNIESCLARLADPARWVTEELHIRADAHLDPLPPAEARPAASGG